MAADAQEATLQKVDSAVADGDADVKGKPKEHRRSSSSASNAHNINDLEKEGVELKISPDTQKLNWKVNTSPSTVDDKDALKKMVCQPPVKKVDLVFPLGSEVTARNLKGVTIKDALDAIYKQYKKKEDDELEEPYLAGFEWDKEESYGKFKVHFKKTGEAPSGGSKKKKGAKAEE